MGCYAIVKNLFTIVEAAVDSLDRDAHGKMISWDQKCIYSLYLYEILYKLIFILIPRYVNLCILKISDMFNTSKGASFLLYLLTATRSFMTKHQVGGSLKYYLGNYVFIALVCLHIH